MSILRSITRFAKEIFTHTYIVAVVVILRSNIFSALGTGIPSRVLVAVRILRAGEVAHSSIIFVLVVTALIIASALIFAAFLSHSGCDDVKVIKTDESE